MRAIPPARRWILRGPLRNHT